MHDFRHVLVTGGAGYVGSVLVPRLLQAGHTVTVLDLYLYGDDILRSVADHPSLVQVKGDIRNEAAVEKALAGCDCVIHLACISNDPSFELNPELGKSVNYDAFRPLVCKAKAAGVTRFIYASSSSVYGIKEEEEVTEDLSLAPLTDYSKYKVLCESILHEERELGFETLVLRPATVCGYAPRQRLDVIVNILTNHAVVDRKVKVFGGSQARPNIHIQDMSRAYEMAVILPPDLVDGYVFNVGYDNNTVMNLAEIVRAIVSNDNKVGGEIGLEVIETDDERSYRVSAKRIMDVWGFKPEKTVADAVRDLVAAYKDGRLSNTMENNLYYNIRTMQANDLR